MRTIIL